MKRNSLEGDEFAWELEMAFTEVREDVGGFEDDKGIQARLERVAMNEMDVDRRKELLARALL